MADVAHSFDDSAAYERFMGRWSRAAGEVFVDWLAPPAGARWLDVGCGTGVFTELILDTCLPSAVFGVDSEGESFSVVNGGAAQAEVFSDFIGTSMCQGVNARDRR